MLGGLHIWMEELDLSRIRDVAKLELNFERSDLIEKLNSWLDIVFEEWKREYGQAPTTVEFTGLLGPQIPKAESAEANRKEIDITTAAPWNCAGWSVSNPIDLALKLWGDNYKPFMDIIEKAGSTNVLAVLILRVDNRVHSNSIFRAYDLMLQGKVWRLEAIVEHLGKEERKRLAALAEGRAKAVENKKAASIQHKADWDQWAVETKKLNPNWGIERIAKHVLETSKRNNHKMANGKHYKESTIAKSIQGFWERYEASIRGVN